VLFTPDLVRLLHAWIGNDDYSHGFFVIPITLWIVWQKRQKLLSLPAKPSWLGFPLFIGGVTIYSVGLVTRFHTLTHLSMVITILGLLLFFSGWRPTKELLFPVLFLLFMFPIPSAYYILITNPLKLVITKVSAQLISFAGIPVYRDGNLLFLATTQLEVAEACSGIRSLYSYLMLGCLFAFMSRRKVAKMILVLSTILLALFVNIVRVTGTGILANFYGSQVAQGFFHEFAGLLLFVIGFIVLFLEYHLIGGGPVTTKA